MRQLLLLVALVTNTGCDDSSDDTPQSLPSCIHDESIETTLTVVTPASQSGDSVVRQAIQVRVHVSVPPDMTVLGVELGVGSGDVFSLNALQDVTFTLMAAADATQSRTWLVDVPLDVLLAPLELAPGAAAEHPAKVFVAARPILNCSYPDDALNAVGHSPLFMVDRAPPPST